MVDQLCNEERRASCRRTLLAVAVVATLMHTISLCATQLWIYPDSVDYVELAGGIVSRGDWSNELFLIRPPGYPLFLATVFKVFGDASPTAIQVLQHLMGIAIAILAALLAIRVSGRNVIGLLAGILGATSLQMLAYCNMPLTEIPATLALMGAICFLLRYWQAGDRRSLALSSACAGVAYLIKPVAVFFFGIIGCVVVIQSLRGAWKADQLSMTRGRIRVAEIFRRFVQRLTVPVSIAVLPAALIATPYWIQSAVALGSNGTSRCLDYVLYVRPVEFDRLDTTDTTSAALREIRSVVAEAKGRGLIDPRADYRDRQTVLEAFHRLRGTSFAESTKMLGRAGTDIILEHPGAFATNTLKYAAWTILAPDPVYRFVPGGAPGVDGQRDKRSAFFDIATYSAGAGSWQDTLAKHAAYLPLSKAPRFATPFWNGIKKTFRAQIDHSPSPIGLRDSLFEEFILVCLAGGIVSLFGRHKSSAAILLGIVVAYLAITAFLAGPQTRYAVVIKPILCVWGAFAIASSYDLICIALGKIAAMRQGSKVKCLRTIPELPTTNS